MLAALLARFLSARAARLIAGLLPYVLIAALVGGGVWWVSNLQSRLARAEASAKETAKSLQVEQAARTRDVAALTALAKGTAAAAADNKRDATILSETIDAAHPKPASPDLAALLNRLRQADTAAAVQRATAGTGGAATR